MNQAVGSYHLARPPEVLDLILARTSSPNLRPLERNPTTIVSGVCTRLVTAKQSEHFGFRARAGRAPHLDRRRTTMNIKDLKDLYVAELQEARSVEAQLTEALPTMIEAASAGDLKQALEDHLGETRSQLGEMDAILQRHGADALEHRDQSMQSIISEAEKWTGMVEDPACRDAGLIASAQRVEHYEIAVYGTLTTWAKQLGLDEEAATLHAILDQEKAADGKLTRLGKGSVNAQAAH